MASSSETPVVDSSEDIISLGIFKSMIEDLVSEDDTGYMIITNRLTKMALNLVGYLSGEKILFVITDSESRGNFVSLGRSIPGFGTSIIVDSSLNSKKREDYAELRLKSFVKYDYVFLDAEIDDETFFNVFDTTWGTVSRYFFLNYYVSTEAADAKKKIVDRLLKIKSKMGIEKKLGDFFDKKVDIPLPGGEKITYGYFQLLPIGIELGHLMRKEPIEETKMPSEEAIDKRFDSIREVMFRILVTKSEIMTQDFFDLMFRGEFRQVWISAITLEFDNRRYNLETLEFIGDRIFNAVESDYFIRHLLLDKSEATNLLQHYISKKFYPLVYDFLEMGDMEYVIPALKNDFSIKEDAFESMIGALFVVSNNVKQGIGYVLIYELANYIFGNITIDYGKKDIADISYINQNFKKLGIGDANGNPRKDYIEFETNPMFAKCNLYIKVDDPEIKNFFSRVFGSPLENGEFLIGSSGKFLTKNLSKEKAYAVARRRLEGVGFDKFIEKYKTDILKQENLRFFGLMNKIAHDENLRNPELLPLKYKSGVYIVSIVGHNEKGSEIIIFKKFYQTRTKSVPEIRKRFFADFIEEFSK